MLPGQQYLPEDLLRIAWRRKWFIVIPLVAAAVGTILVTSRLTNWYRSETVILVVPQRVPESYVRSTVTARIEDRLASIQQQILSRSRLERIIQDFDLYPDERKRLVMEDVVERMRRDIEGPTIERGDAFRVGFVSKDPRVAQRVTERLASLFIEENLRDREVLAEGTSQFLDAQLEEAKQRLLEKEKALEQYRRQHSGELPTQVEANLEAIQRMQVQVQSLTDALNRDAERRATFERQLTDLEAVSAIEVPVVSRAGDDTAGAPTAQRLEDARVALRTLELRLKPEHPDILIAKRKIRDLETQLQAETAGRPAPTGERTASVTPAETLRRTRLRDLRAEIQKIDDQMATKHADERRLRGLVETYQRRIDVAPTRESELIELTRDYTTLDSAYKSLLAKWEDSKVAASLERRQIGEQFKVLDPARMPERPFSPNRLRINLMVSLVGLAVGVGLVGMLEYRDTSFKNDRDVARVLQLPVLAVVPMMRSEHELQVRRQRRVLVTVGTVVMVAASASAFAAWQFQIL